MKRTSPAIICFLFISQIIFAQSISVTSNVGRLYDGIDNVRQGFKVTPKKKGFLVAAEPGFISKGETFENILKKGGSDFYFTLEKEQKPKLKKESKKLEFSHFFSEVVTYTTYNGYMYGGINLKDNDYAVAMNQTFKDWGFNTVSEDDQAFRTKNNVANYAIAGNIIRYDKTSRGTSSFEMAMLVRWAVYDVYNEENAIIVTTAGYSNSHSRNKEKDDAILAMKDALKGLMSNAEFLKLINNENKIDNSKLLQSFKLNNGPAANFTDYGKMVTTSIKSCVTVKTLQGHGSGFVISDDGYILTNDHVVSDTSKIEVIFDNGFKFPARLIRNNNVYDVALLKIDGSGFTPLSIDTTDAQLVGSEVITIGTPEDIRLGQTVTKGIVSSVRSIDDRKFIQTDVSINPGNSGGPLISRNGNVIGIITSKMYGEKIQGLGFAVPINFALEKINLLLKK